MSNPEELAGLMKTAELHRRGKTDASIHAVVETYKGRVKDAGDDVAGLAKIIAHARREHPGPFHGFDEAVLTALLVILSRESDKSLAATLVGVALREAGKYTWRGSRQPHEYQWNGRPVFMTGEDAGCPACVPGEPLAEEEPAPEDEQPVERVDLTLHPSSLGMLRTMDKDKARSIHKFLYQLAADLPPGTAEVEPMIEQHVAGGLDGLENAAATIAQARSAMKEAGVEGTLRGLNEPDALVVLGHLMKQPKAHLVAALFGVATSMAEVVGEFLNPVPGQRRSRLRPASFMEGLMTKGAAKR